MTKQNTKKTSKKLAWRKPAYVAIALVGGLALIAQICLDMHFWRATQYSTGEPITSMIAQAIRNLNTPAIIEPVSKKVYLPTASIVLPPYPQSVPTIEYSYTPSNDGADAEANVTVGNAISLGISKLLNAEALGQQRHDPSLLFTAVPEAQACSRGLHMVFGTKTKYDHLEFSKQLRDGRVMSVYSEKTKCSYDLTHLTTYLKSAESY